MTVARRLADARVSEHPAAWRPRADGLVVAVTIVLLSLVTVVTLFLPGLSFATVSPGTDLVLNTIAMTIAGAVAGLAWIRFREARQAHELFQASAFLALAVGGFIALGLTVSGLGESFGFSLASPGQAPFYLWDLQRFAAGLLFLAAGWIGYRDPHRAIGRPFLVLLGPTALLVLASGLVLLLAPGLPELRSAEQIAQLSSSPQLIDLDHLGAAIAALELGIALLFILAAILFRRTYLRFGQRPLAYLVLGLIVAATAQVHSIFVPTSYSGVITSVDLFRVTFYGILLVGVATGARGDLRTLRLAHEELRGLRDAEVRAAGLQERSRLAREMHDGLIQDLWVARLKAGHLLGVGDLPQQGQLIAEQLDRALDAAVSEARLALGSLTADPDASGSLPGSLERLVEEMAGHLEPDVSVELAADLPAIPGKVEVELLRIVREAIMNAGKHADATLVRVMGWAGDGVLGLEVVDNGEGFDVRSPSPGYGLRSMRERADLIGARLIIGSRQHDGTRVSIELPVDDAGPASSDERAGRDTPPFHVAARSGER